MPLILTLQCAVYNEFLYAAENYSPLRQLLDACSRNKFVSLHVEK